MQCFTHLSIRNPGMAAKLFNGNIVKPAFGFIIERFDIASRRKAETRRFIRFFLGIPGETQKRNTFLLLNDVEHA